MLSIRAARSPSSVPVSMSMTSETSEASAAATSCCLVGQRRYKVADETAARVMTAAMVSPP